MPTLTIDGKIISVEEGITVMQACEQAGIEIPRFCYHDRLRIAGNCRMCLVEMEKAPKLIASCAINVADGMVIHTNTAKVQKARNGVMEFLLINHPLDCPICDQGGECDLQDQAFKYGIGRSRYHENKRAVKEKEFGVLIKTHMTRCIHCTRCIRFATDIAGISELGTTGRGENMEITTYLENAITSELSGNLIDICPVGALTSKPYAFKARSWELEKTESIDVMDALGSNIRIDSVGLEVMRILPRLNEEINEEWISDKARFSYDGLKYQRLDTPYIKQFGKFVKASWDEAIGVLIDNLSKINNTEIASIAGTMVPCEAMFMMKKILNELGSNFFDANQFGYKFDISNRANYLFNTTIAGIESADFCLLIGANPRHAAPVLNSKIGRIVRERDVIVARIGEVDDQSYDIIELGDDIAILEELISGTHQLNKIIKSAKNPMIIVGDAILSRTDSLSILSLLDKLMSKYNFIHDNWNGFNILHNHASIVGALDLAIYSHNGVKKILESTHNDKVKCLYLLGADEIDMSKIGDDTFVVYQGHHGDSGANRADIIFPSAAYTEQDGIYTNLEGRHQYARKAVDPIGIAKDDWEILNIIGCALRDSGKIKSFVEIGNIYELRELMQKEYTVFRQINQIKKSNFVKFTPDSKLLKQNVKKIPINYYLTNSISRASVTMSKCAKQVADKANY